MSNDLTPEQEAKRAEKIAAHKAQMQDMRDRRVRRHAIRDVPEVKALQLFLRGATAGDIDAWYADNIKTPVDQENLLKIILKIIANRVPVG